MVAAERARKYASWQAAVAQALYRSGETVRVVVCCNDALLGGLPRQHAAAEALFSGPNLRMALSGRPGLAALKVPAPSEGASSTNRKPKRSRVA